MAMQKAMNEIQRCTISCQINNVLNIQNGIFIGAIYNLLINSSILVYHKRNADQSEE